MNQHLYLLKGYKTRQLRTKFIDEGWTTSTINGLFKKFRDTGTQLPTPPTPPLNRLFSEPLTFIRSKQICLQKAHNLVYNCL